MWQRNRANILLVDDEPSTRTVLKRILQREGYKVTIAQNGAEGLHEFEQHPFELVLLDLVLPDQSGMSVLKEIKQRNQQAIVIIVTAHATLESAMQAVREGAYDYISKAFENLDQVRLVIQRGIKAHTLIQKNEELLGKLKVANSKLAWQKKKLAERVVQAGEELRALEAKAQQMDKLAALGELSAKVVHETRNPIAIMDGFVQLLPTKYDDPRFREKFIQTMARELASLTRITGRLLEFARPKEIAFQETDLNIILRELIHDLEGEFQKKGTELTSELSETLPLLWADPSALRQVFLNLVNNAMGVINGKGKIHIQTAVQEKEVVATVSDNGPGISPKDLPKIFELFYTTKRGGTGLGLPISRQIVEKHFGSIEVQSIPGRGATFHVVLPTMEDAKKSLKRRVGHESKAYSGH